MTRRLIIPSLIALAMLTAPAFAQEEGGRKLSPDVLQMDNPQASALGNVMNALRFQPNNNSVNRAPATNNLSQKNKDNITKLRGDAGFLGGFSQGNAIQQSALDRQQARRNKGGGGGGDQGGGFADPGGCIDCGGGTVNKTVTVIKNITNNGSIIKGDNNIVQQQQVTPGAGGGPTAAQQVLSVGGDANATNSAVNKVAKAKDTAVKVKRAPAPDHQ